MSMKKVCMQLKVFCFIMIGILIFAGFQYIFVPKRFPYDTTGNAGKLTGYYNEENNSIDVLIGGTSHAAKGILPMQLYESNSITAYNLATSNQPIECTYFLLSEAILTQKPKVFIYDVSSLYIDSLSATWWYVLDDMPIGKNKLALAQVYLNTYQYDMKSFKEIIFPLLKYHTRWKELSQQEFVYFFLNRHHYSKGMGGNSNMYGAISVETMNFQEDELIKKTMKSEYIYNNGEFLERHENDILYDTAISEKNIEWLKKIKKLCDDNDIQLLATKVPAVYFPQQGTTAWTEGKFHKVQEICTKYNIAYYDLLYEADLNLDWSHDSEDGGYHLNLYGAQKVTAALGKYLKKCYELPVRHNEQWDKDLLLYQKSCKSSLLRLEQDFDKYIEMLACDYKDKMIFIAASYDMSMGLNEADINALNNLGLKSDFSDAANNSFIAVIEDGIVKYEILSNRKITYDGICSKSGKEFTICSSGWWTNSGASIKLQGDEIAYNAGGLNIVVYDDDRELVLDSVCFNTCDESHVAMRNGNNCRTSRYESEFEQYIVEVENK